VDESSCFTIAFSANICLYKIYPLLLFNSEDMLLAALEDLRAGRSLVETAAAYRIPRSTLHVKARAQGIALTITRQEHSGERVQAAIQAVAGILTL
jgi:hypothetical protein